MVAQRTRLMREYLQRILQPGDMLVYSSRGVIGWLIKLKTYSEYTHVAVYIGNGMVREFKEFHGAQEVGLDTKNLVMIRRPKGSWDRAASDVFWEEVKDQQYDYFGLFFSFIARWWGRENHRMFCSEYYARDFQRSVKDVSLFSDITDCDGVSPGDCVRSPGTLLVWLAKDGE